MPARKHIEVSILGELFTVRTDDSEEYVQQLAVSVDERMRRIADTAETASSKRIAIMAALSFADEAWKAMHGQDKAALPAGEEENGMKEKKSRNSRLSASS